MLDMNVKTLTVLCSLPVISGLIGYVTNRLALWMLFHPRREMRFMGVSFHGLVPSRQPEIARSVAATVTGQLVTPAIIAEKLQDERVQQALVRGLSDYTRRYVADFMDALPAPVLLLLPRDAEDAINKKIENYARRHLPEIVTRVAPAVAAELDLAAAVETRVAAYPPHELEAIVKKLANRELRAIELWGGVLGFIIGLAQALLAHFLA